MGATTVWPELDAVDAGYYAIPDPDGAHAITYWRRVRTARTDDLRAWPPKSWYGPPIPSRADIPEGRLERAEFAIAWATARRAYMAKVVAAITAEPVAAGRRFAAFGIRCCKCARVLSDDRSKTYGIGPECRRGIPDKVLARYCTPQVGRIHADHLAANPEPGTGEAR